MKRIIFISFLTLALMSVSRSASAQTGKELCYTSSELLDMLCTIQNRTVIEDLDFLAVVPCIFSAESQAGFYVKDKKAGDKWCLVLSRSSEEGDYWPNYIMGYEEAVKYDDSPNYKDLTRAFKGKYRAGRLIVLAYDNKDRGKPFFDVYDIELRKVISN